MQLYIGTGGYSNEDWRGLLYPEQCKPSDYLGIYSRYFNAVEVNSSFYAIPGEKAFAGMLNKTDGRLHFSVKLHQIFTHERTPTPEHVARMRQSPEPLMDAGVLGMFVAQFPYSFKRTPQNRRYLVELVSWFSGIPLAIEFRHASWFKPEVIAAFAEQGLIWVASDYPPLEGLPPFAIPEQQTVYLRLHGRNTQNWWEGKDASARHDYRYSEQELQSFVDSITQLKKTQKVWLMWQNTTKGHALYNFHTLKELLAPHELWQDPASGLF